jgi:predicted AAA+ superfamily ATPase
LNDKKIVIITGARQVGKTSLIEAILFKESYLELNGDDMADRAFFEVINTEKLRSYVGNHTYLFVDEAQKIPNIGDALKIIHDKIKTIKVLVTGSSSFELNQKIQESLTGRKWEFSLFPISWSEYVAKHGLLTAQKQLESRLIFGMYPDVLNNPGDESDILKALSSSYLFKDIFALHTLKRPELLDKIIRALAYQVGSEVSYNEIAQLVGADKNTVNHYIELLCQAFVIYKLPSFSRNLRNEIKTSQKIYFYDNGIRNVVIGNLQPLHLRNDAGQLWENFLISERLKYNAYQQRMAKSYFWRTTTQREIDYVEDRDGQISAFECKWSAHKKKKADKEFQEVYNTQIKILDRETWDDFVR